MGISLREHINIVDDSGDRHEMLIDRDQGVFVGVNEDEAVPLIAEFGILEGKFDVRVPAWITPVQFLALRAYYPKTTIPLGWVSINSEDDQAAAESCPDVFASIL